MHTEHYYEVMGMTLQISMIHYNVSPMAFTNV